MLISELDKKERHVRKLTQLRSLIKSYPIANSALDFAGELHIGVRKDGETPEFYHQVSIVRLILKFSPHLMYTDETLAAGFLHDVAEDYKIEFDHLDQNFGTKVGRAVDLVTKKTHTGHRNEEQLFALMADDAIASIVKGCDRIHNQSTMGVFDQTKKNSYMDFTDTLIIPMLLKARENFPSQAPAYNTMLRVLGYQKTRHYNS